MTSLSKSHYFGFRGGLDGGVQLTFWGPIMSFTSSISDDRRDKLLRCSPSILRELLSDSSFEGVDREELEKPALLFGNLVLISKVSLFEDECKWLSSG